MLTGICKLCLSKANLQLSHLMPRSLYKKLRSKGKGNNDPCVVTARTFRRSSWQYTDHVFCKKCEDRFNLGGEDYVMSILPNQTGFPLLEILERAQPFRQKDDWKAYTAAETPTIDRTQLSYFALSVFWRASAHRWTLKDHAPIEIELGKLYNEGLRRYLLGETEVPTQANLSVSVCTDLMSRKVMNPPTAHVKNGLRSFGLFACGVDFDLCISKSAPSWAQHLSVLRKPDQMIVSYDPARHPRWHINATLDDQAALKRSMESFGQR
jgi:hypothetical protein